MIWERFGAGFGAVGWPGRERAAGVGDLDDGLELVCEGGCLDNVLHGELDVVIDLDPHIEFGLEEECGGSAAGSGDESVLADDAELTAEGWIGGEPGGEVDPGGEDGAADVAVGVGGDVDGRRALRRRLIAHLLRGIRLPVDQVNVGGSESRELA